MLPILHTKRLELRPLRASDAESLHDAFSDEKLMAYWSSEPHKDLVETERYITGNMTAKYPTWAIAIGEGPAIGWVVLIPHRDGVREIGYILRRDAWGKGYASEAVTRIIDYGFRELGLRRIFADVDPDNAASIVLLEKLGFVREGLLRAEWETHIGVRDSYIYGLLAADWQHVRVSVQA